MSIKRIIGISTFAADIVGGRTLYLDQKSYDQMASGRRRATRTKTLDGAAVVYDAGFAVADQTFTLDLRATDATLGAWVAYIVKTYNLIRISTTGGVFSCVPSSWEETNGVVTLEALVMEQLA